MLDPQQAREDAKQLRAMLAKFPAEQVYVHREWASRLATYAERLARVCEIVAERLGPAEVRLRSAKLRLQEDEYRYAEWEVLIDRRDELCNAEIAVAELTALLGEGETDEGGA